MVKFLGMSGNHTGFGHRLGRFWRRIVKSCMRPDFYGRPLSGALISELREDSSLAVKVSLHECVALDLFAFRLSDNTHPFFIQAKQILNDISTPIEETALYQWYLSARPRSVADMYSCNATDDGDITSLPPAAAEFPWRAAPSASIAENRRKKYLRKALRGSFAVSEFPDWEFIGPVCPQVISFEHYRISSIIESVRSDGYRNCIYAGLVSVDVLVNEHCELRPVISSGQHRAPVLFAMGIPTIFAQISGKRIFRRDDVTNWPAVRSGHMSQGHALEVFDRVFSGVQPDFISASWSEKCESMLASGK